MEKRYTVGQAAELTGVKSYVLRYWEEELGLFIHRNELGHRYYTGYDIQLFLNIKELKERGLQLRAIKEAIPHCSGEVPEIAEETGVPEEHHADDFQQTFQPEKDTIPELPGKTADAQSEKIVEFQHILERLIAQEMSLKNSEEVRCRKIDEAIRRQQNARREAAAASDRGRHKTFSKT